MPRLAGTQPRMTGNVHPRIPSTAPLQYRLSNEVYSLDGLGSDYIVQPGADLKVGPGGRLYETMGDVPSTRCMLIAGAGALAIWWMFFRKKGRRR